MELGYDYTQDMVAGGGTRHLFRGSLGWAFNPFSFLLVRPEAALPTLAMRTLSVVFLPIPQRLKKEMIFSVFSALMSFLILVGSIQSLSSIGPNAVQLFILNFEENFISGGIQVGF